MGQKVVTYCSLQTRSEFREVMGLRVSRRARQANTKGLVGVKHQALSNRSYLLTYGEDTHLWGY